MVYANNVKLIVSLGNPAPIIGCATRVQCLSNISNSIWRILRLLYWLLYCIYWNHRFEMYKTKIVYLLCMWCAHCNPLVVRVPPTCWSQNKSIALRFLNAQLSQPYSTNNNLTLWWKYRMLSAQCHVSVIKSSEMAQYQFKDGTLNRFFKTEVHSLRQE